MIGAAINLFAQTKSFVARLSRMVIKTRKALNRLTPTASVTIASTPRAVRSESVSASLKNQFLYMLRCRLHNFPPFSVIAEKPAFRLFGRKTVVCDSQRAGTESSGDGVPALPLVTTCRITVWPVLPQFTVVRWASLNPAALCA